MENENLIETIDKFDAWLANTIESLAENGYHHTLARREDVEASK